MRWVIRSLIEWAMPELAGRRPVEYIVIEGSKIVHRGMFENLRGHRDIPWQITMPLVAPMNLLDHGSPPEPYEFETYFRHRGSLDPVMYFKMEAI